MTHPLPITLIMILGLSAAAQTATAACIDPTKTDSYHKTKELFEVGGSTFGVDLDVKGGLWSARDLREPLALLGLPVSLIPSDYAAVMGGADADLTFFGKEISLLALGAKAIRSDGEYTKKFTIEIAGKDLHSGSNNLSSSMKEVTFSAPFYTAVASYGVATTKGTIWGEIGVRSRGAASSSGLDIEGRGWAALILEGSAGVSVGVAGIGLSGEVDLLEVGVNFLDKTGLSSGSYTLDNSYDARTIDGQLAVKGSVLGLTKTLWEKSWSGKTLASAPLYNASGCID
jgi:hypothetical protein